MSCIHCGSDRHISEECSTLNLTRYLLGQDYDEDHIPDLTIVVDEDDLFSAIDEAHALQHIGKSVNNGELRSEKP